MSESNPSISSTLLYGLDTVLRLHFAQEEELSHVLSDPA